MPYRSSQYEDDSDEDSWDDDDLDDDEDDDSSTVPCPYCCKPVYEDAEFCSNCNEYISLEDAPPKQKPFWVTVVVILLLVSMFFWFVR